MKILIILGIIALLALIRTACNYAGKCNKCRSRRNWKRCVDSVTEGDMSHIFHNHSAHCSNCGHIEDRGQTIERYSDQPIFYPEVRLINHEWYLRWRAAAGRPINFGAP